MLSRPGDGDGKFGRAEGDGDDQTKHVHCSNRGRRRPFMPPPEPLARAFKLFWVPSTASNLELRGGAQFIAARK
jgi:hypothetical protein